jgi:hypothetical protein
MMRESMRRTENMKKWKARKKKKKKEHDTGTKKIRKKIKKREEEMFVEYKKSTGIEPRARSQPCRGTECFVFISRPIFIIQNTSKKSSSVQELTHP